MTNKNLTIGLLITLVIAVSGLFLPRVGTKFGAASPSDVQSTNFTQVTTNALTVNTSNTATSTTAVGCVQAYATSTATAIHLEFSTTTALATYTGGSAITSTVGGTVAWKFGSCPF